MPTIGLALHEETGPMDERSRAVTRRSLHGVAELVPAGPQYSQETESILSRSWF